MTTYYVEGGVGSGGDGSSGNPWDKILTANGNATPDDTVIIRDHATGGRYVDDPIAPVQDRIMYQAASGALPTITGSATRSVSFAIDFSSRSSCIADGIVVDGLSLYPDARVSSVSDVRDSTGSQIINGTYRNTYGEMGNLNEGSIDFLFDNNDCSKHGIHASLHPTGVDYGDYFYSQSTKSFDTVISNNYFHTGCGGHEVVQQRRASGIILRGNVFDGDWSWLTGDPEHLIRAFSFSHTGSTEEDGVIDYLIESNRFLNIAGDNDAITRGMKLMGIRGIFRNNLIINAKLGYAVIWQALPLNKGYFNKHIYSYNNTFYNLGRGFMEVEIDTINGGVMEDQYSFNNVVQLTRQDQPQSDPKNDTNIKIGHQGLPGGHPALDATYIYSNVLPNTPGDDAYWLEGISGPDYVTLTEAETIEPTHLFNNTEKDVTFPDNTGDDFADFYAPSENAGGPYAEIAAGDAGSGTTYTVNRTRAFVVGDGFYINATKVVITAINSDTELVGDTGVSRSNGDDLIWDMAYNGGNTLQGVYAYTSSEPLSGGTSLAFDVGGNLGGAAAMAGSMSIDFRTSGRAAAIGAGDIIGSVQLSFSVQGYLVDLPEEEVPVFTPVSLTWTDIPKATPIRFAED